MHVADLVFGVCLLAGGALLLLTLVLDDIFSGLFGAIHLGFDVAGVSPAPMLLGFLAMFGIGGLFGLHGLGAGVGVATLTGIVAGRLAPASYSAPSRSSSRPSRQTRSGSRR